MKAIVCALLAFVSTMFRSRLSLQFEIVALRHQLTVYQRVAQRPQLIPGTVYSGLGSQGTGRGGGMRWSLSRQGP